MAKYFTDWQGCGFDELVALCREYLEECRFEPLEGWREDGGKVVGHFQVYFPEEIVHAAGMFPLKLRGAPVEPRIADAHFGSYLCSILKTSLELAMSERISLDMFVTHPICDAARNLAAVWGRKLSRRRKYSSSCSTQICLLSSVDIMRSATCSTGKPTYILTSAGRGVR